MKTLLNIAKVVLVMLVVAAVAVVAIVQLTWQKKYDAPYPEIRASADSAVIARGAYLANGPAHCGTCHVPHDKVVAVDGGERIPFSGGWTLPIPGLGTLRSPNLTPDLETGIGKFTDAEIARAVRHGVGRDGRALFPIMGFQGMSDADLTAIVSYLRSQPPVEHAVEPVEYKFMARALFAFGVFKPEGPKETPPKSVPIDSTVEYGQYVANHVGQCRGCHTQMNMSTGQYIGADFAGKGLFTPDEFTQGFAYVSPNLTPDPGTGIMASWSEEEFMTRFKTGRVHPGSPMPWGAFTEMDDVELKALYRYFQSLNPVENKIDQIVYNPGEKLPKF